MFRSAILSVAIVACLLGGSHGAFVANWPPSSGNGTNSSMTMPMPMEPSVSAVLVMDTATSTRAVIRVTVTNVADYAWTTLAMGNTTDGISTILWVDPAKTCKVDPTNPSTKDIMGSMTFEYTFSSSALVGPLGYPGVRLNALWNALWNGTVYVVVSTAENVNGSLIELLTPAAEVFYANLSGSNVVPSPLETDSMGVSKLTISADYTNATVELTMENVAGYFMSHIHVGNSTTNGAIALWINPSAANLLGPQFFDVGILLFTVHFNASQTVGLNGRSLNQFAALARNQGLYANIHTQTYMGGVIRGQYMGAYPVVK